jgi:glycosyltransferase involved in cell wall biosynthesis
MMFPLRLVFLVNWREEGRWTFLDWLGKMVQSVAVLQPVSFRFRYSGPLIRISHYLSEFYVPLMAALGKKRYDVVISWQMRLGVCYGILKRLCHPQELPLHVIQDFHIDLTKTRGLYRVQLALLKLAIPGIDYFFCTSREEEEIYSRMFRIPRDRIVFLPLTESSSNFREPRQSPKDYIFSYGKSDRDFDTLIRSVATLSHKTYILSRTYVPSVPVPEHVCIIRDYIPQREMVQWISASRLVVLPLLDYRISAGQISMLEVMALARPLIITENMATKEYASHQHSALFFKAGNDKELRDHIQHLWHNPEIAEKMGELARQTAMTFDHQRMTVFSNLLSCCAGEIEKGEHP